MADNQRQKEKKNRSRIKSKDRGLYPSIQRNYNKPKQEEENQAKLF